jgi:hypothetical protein
MARFAAGELGPNRSSCDAEGRFWSSLGLVSRRRDSAGRWVSDLCRPARTCLVRNGVDHAFWRPRAAYGARAGAEILSPAAFEERRYLGEETFMVGAAFCALDRLGLERFQEFPLPW